ncbi:transposase, IS4 family protein [Caballeronia telluris]|uniref:Transposase, IS4 family protein n=1 Tax=Caballeronia telluris TaxID=326475 RepID=A0A158KFU9_9BURK|nr:transposase, IS4 family protein [Caballeronia telluris]
MSQMDLGLNLSTKRTRKREFLDEMTRVVPWQKLIDLIEPHYPKGKTGRPGRWRKRCTTYRCIGSSRCWIRA